MTSGRSEPLAALPLPGALVLAVLGELRASAPSRELVAPPSPALVAAHALVRRRRRRRREPLPTL